MGSKKHVTGSCCILGGSRRNCPKELGHSDRKFHHFSFCAYSGCPRGQEVLGGAGGGLEPSIRETQKLL